MINPVVNPPAPAQKPVKDKPLVKTPVPGTDWIRVKTTQGNTFYSHKIEKRSMWTVPDEIQEALAALEKEEQDLAERLSREQEEEAARIETERVKAQIAKETAKRKAQDPVPVDEVLISKRVRVDDEREDEEMDDGEEDGDDDGGEEDSDDDDDEEEEEWQKEAATQLAAEAEEHERQKKEEEKAELNRIQDEEKLKEDYKTQHLNMPAKVELAPEEAKALFKVRLLHPYSLNP
jgi:transcription elongation regulator 1